MNEAMLGSIAVASFVVGLFFMNYWRSSGDRFFLYLMASFWLEAANRVGMVAHLTWTEDAPVHYLVRLVSYGLILVAIWDKNRQR